MPQVNKAHWVIYTNRPMDLPSVLYIRTSIHCYLPSSRVLPVGCLEDINQCTLNCTMHMEFNPWSCCSLRAGYGSRTMLSLHSVTCRLCQHLWLCVCTYTAVYYRSAVWLCILLDGCIAFPLAVLHLSEKDQIFQGTNSAGIFQIAISAISASMPTQKMNWTPGTAN